LRGGLKRSTKRLFGNQPAAVLQSKRDAAYWFSCRRLCRARFGAACRFWLLQILQRPIWRPIYPFSAR